MATKIYLKHDSGVLKPSYEGFSWTTLFFGLFVPLFRGDFKWFLIALVVAVFNYALCTIGIGFITTPVWWIFFAVKYNEWHRNDLFMTGFKSIN